jgi:putative hemolysin
MLSSFFSGSETALFSLKKWQIRQIEVQHKVKSQNVIHLLASPRNLLITVLIGNILVNVTISTVAESFCHRYFSRSSLLIAIIGTTIFLLIFGETTPKLLAIKFARKIALSVAFPLMIFQKIISPILKLFSATSMFFIRLFNKRTVTERSMLTPDEVRGVMDMGIREGIMNPRENTIISRILQLGQVKVSKITLPLDKMFAIEKNTPPDIAIPIIIKKGFSRIPVFENKTGKIKGVLLMKDLLPYWSGIKKLDSLDKVMVEPVFIRWNQRAMNALRILRTKRMHMAFVINSQKAVIGFITMQDLVNILVHER